MPGGREPARDRLGPVAAAHGDRAGQLRPDHRADTAVPGPHRLPADRQLDLPHRPRLVGWAVPTGRGDHRPRGAEPGRRTGRRLAHRNRVRFVRRRGGQVHHPAQRLLLPAGRTDHLWLPGGDLVGHRARRTAPVAEPAGPPAGGHRPQPDRGRRHRDPYRDAGHVRAHPPGPRGADSTPRRPRCWTGSRRLLPAPTRSTTPRRSRPGPVIGCAS